jgi:BetI-type transcriptional repressor, C-terminal
MDDDKHDLPYPYNQDLSGVLRGQLPNSRVTAAIMRAVVQLVERNLGPGAGRTGALPRFLTQQAVVDEVNEKVRFGCQTTANALRYRWPNQREFYGDIFRFGQWESHYPGAHQDEIADATEQIIHGDDPVQAIHTLCDWDIRRRVSTPMSWLGLLAAAQAEGDPDIQAAIAEHHRENEAAWRRYCEEFLQARRLRPRPGVTLADCVTLLTALADGLTIRAIADPRASQASDRERGHCLLSTGALALITSCAEPDDQSDSRSLAQAAAVLMGGSS